MTLADIPFNTSFLITQIQDQCDNKTRLHRLGVLPGSKVIILRSAPLGDPLQVRIDNTLMSIRKYDAAFIDVEAKA